MKKKIEVDFSKKFNLFFYRYEYQILVLAGIFCGLLIIYLTNKFFVNSKIYFILFLFGIIVSSLGFILEYFIKSFKKNSIENEFSYFLHDLSRELKLTNSFSLALDNISSSNVYGSIDTEIKRISNRVSWGDDFENALKDVNENIGSPIIGHTLLLLKVFKETAVPFDRVLRNISKDISIYKEENQKKKYFNNLYYLAIIFFFIFVFVLLYIDLLIGTRFLWYSNIYLVTRIFFDNFLLYVALVLSFFTAFVMFSIKGLKSITFLKYIFIFFFITIILFQVVIPKPEAEGVLVETINDLYVNDYSSATLDNIISLKSLSSKMLVDNSKAEMVYFISMDNYDCGISCAEYTVLVSDAMFFNFEIERLGSEVIIYYSVKDS
ncbi:MAG: type II secretion system F family protein [archaeon]|jgi:hypothetical protein|nr:type II secretion system F family protein [archaeon]MDD2477842.1 type II secretion system F family protein [Candidatus ainarchaeum sp.]MDD3084578.1 type II secretion system F family protein [Candidatus ainarchaeum sp.]MDD4221133.1 type II secretion system F family protein [Candidatus ainarchaeum sp.]MDD4662621.1 type II secretion system F family protein [Candidatus ainarchaeum sp.]